MVLGGNMCILINSNKCTTLLGIVDNEGSCACVGAEDIWEISVPSLKCYSELKIDLKNKSTF